MHETLAGRYPNTRELKPSSTTANDPPGKRAGELNGQVTKEDTRLTFEEHGSLHVGSFQ